jgi:beta-propeller repeat-containing protein/beta-propeller uncharacterized protein DUF5122
MKVFRRVRYAILSVITLILAVGCADDNTSNPTPPIVEEEHYVTFGGEQADAASGATLAPNGDIMVVGVTESFESGGADIWLMRVNKDGEQIWSKTYGGTENDRGTSICSTADGGYAITGSTNRSVFVMKVDENGNKLWESVIGDNQSVHDFDRASEIKQTKDLGFIIVGTTESESAIGWDDIWVIKVTNSGQLHWFTVFGKGGQDFGYSIDICSDGGFIVGGEMSPSVPGNSTDCIVKLTPTGSVDWIKQFGRTSVSSVLATSDGGSVTAGTNGQNLWIQKNDRNGNMIVQNTIHASHYRVSYEIQESIGGGYLVLGSVYQDNTDKHDYWLLKLNNAFDMVWAKQYGGDEDDKAYNMAQDADGNAFLVGRTKSFGAGDYDALIICVDKHGNKIW